ncbi:MAG: ABC transporter substrate-binding protein [Thermomicrobiales bacterium]|nr:ABC transporter substrate-binding protein [Thermomicrobiales bacterium]
MGRKDPVRELNEALITGSIDRRTFLKRAAALGMVAAGAGAALGGEVGTVAATNAAFTPELIAKRAAAQVPEVAREDTLVAVRSRVKGKFDEYQIWNPFLPASNHQLGSHLTSEPLAFYSAFMDKTTMWLAESSEYSDDYKTLTIKTRPNVTWSDGAPFSANDVAYTFNQLVEVGPAVKWGADVQQFLDSAEVADENTVICNFKVPAPRFFDFVTYKFDIGVYIMPEHIFKDQNFAEFTFFDIEKGWPVTTGPWRVVYSGQEQKILDRADDWWGVAAGVDKLPEMTRFIYLPDPGEQGLISGIIANNYDIDTGIQPAGFATVFAGNDKVTTWTGQESPFGYVDWWPHSFYVNNEVPPFDDANVRWALSYYLDRQQIIDIAWMGASLPSTLFVPDYPPLQPFMEAVADLIEEYPYLEYNPAKGDELLTAKGWTKNGDGMWTDETGEQISIEIISFFDFTSVGPVVVEQLKRAGIEATYSEPPNFFERFSAGDYTGALFGHGGSYSSDIYYSLRLYQTASEKIPGGHLVNFSRWNNEEYDKLVDELYSISPTEMDKVMEIWKKCMALWLPGYPDIQISQGLHRLPTNTTFWTNWADQENPYVNTAHWHLTFPMVVHALTKAGSE